ncbi:unnamed protein product [Nyctereutes procyonoides]|uniref:(raccoon dog) hypothetical protein n=1 Tax=Nyctereutes procyonoides TaxID=34880 RepID=A0A811ZQ55_NYCPR|nr:unnamed protein product [Nyctereutes procyonoides]
MHREPDAGLDPGSPGSRPGPKAGAKPLRHPGIPLSKNLTFGAETREEIEPLQQHGGSLLLRRTGTPLSFSAGVTGLLVSKFDSKTPLGCLLANLRTLELDQDLRRPRLIHYCTVAWPQYRLNNQSQWPPEGTFDYQILTDLDNLCRRQGKWSEVPYVQAFWTLRSRPELYSSCSTSRDGLRHTPQPERLQMWWPQSSLSTSSRGLGYPGPYSQTTGRHLSPV